MASLEQSVEIDMCELAKDHIKITITVHVVTRKMWWFKVRFRLTMWILSLACLICPADSEVVIEDKPNSETQLR